MNYYKGLKRLNNAIKELNNQLDIVMENVAFCGNYFEIQGYQDQLDSLIDEKMDFIKKGGYVK